MKTFLLLSIIVSQCLATVIGDAATLVQPRSWRPIIAQGMTGDMTHTGPVMDQIYAFSNDAVYDAKTEQLLYIGGPHYAPMRFNVYDAGTNLWRSESFPAGESPLSHTYDNLTIDTGGNMYWLHKDNVYVFNTDSNGWAPLLPGLAVSHYGSLEYFPDRNSLVYVIDGKVYRMSLDTLVWTLHGSGLAMGGYHNLAQYNPVYHAVFFGGGNGDRHQYRLDTNWQVTALPQSPIGYGIAGPKQTVDPVSGDVLFIDSSGVYFYNPSNDSTGRAANSFIRNPGACVVTPVPSLGVVAFLTVTNYPFLLYRHSGTARTGNPPIRITGFNPIAVHPNPFNGPVRVRLDFPVLEILSVSLFSAQGRLISNFSPERELLLNGKELSPGAYFMSVKSNERIYAKKLIRVK